MRRQSGSSKHLQDSKYLVWIAAKLTAHGTSAQTGARPGSCSQVGRWGSRKTPGGSVVSLPAGMRSSKDLGTTSDTFSPRRPRHRPPRLSTCSRAHHPLRLRPAEGYRGTWPLFDGLQSEKMYVRLCLCPPPPMPALEKMYVPLCLALSRTSHSALDRVVEGAYTEDLQRADSPGQAGTAIRLRADLEVKVVFDRSEVRGVAGLAGVAQECVLLHRLVSEYRDRFHVSVEGIIIR